MPSSSVVWSGQLQFGLVVVPVRLVVAARPQSTRFKRMYRKRSLPSTQVLQFPTTWSDEDKDDAVDSAPPSPRVAQLIASASLEHADASEETYAPVRQVLTSSEGEEVHPTELVKAFETAPDQFAIIDPEEVRRAGIETSDGIELFHFVDSAQVDPIYFEKSYYLVPQAGAEKAYALLLEAMQQENCYGIARVAMHRREHILILRPRDHYLLAHTMFYVNEIRPAPVAVDPGLVSERELTVARALVKGYAGEFEPEKFQDIYQARLREIIDQAKRIGASHATPSEAPKPQSPPDLMEAIRLSLAQLEKKPAASSSKRPPRAASTSTKAKTAKKK